MEDFLPYIVGLVAAVGGGAVGYILKSNTIDAERLKLEAENERQLRQAERTVSDAQNKAKDIEREAKDVLSDAKHQASQMQVELEKQSARLEERDKKLSKDVEMLEAQRQELKSEHESLKTKQQELQDLYDQQAQALEQVAGLTAEQAQEQLMEQIERTKEQDLLRRMKAFDYDIDSKIEEKARKALSEAIQRYSSEVTSEITQTIVNLPSDDIKGRIIGREGRNINALERATGVDIIIDDTPNAVILSGYDLLRRYIAKRAIEQLVEDGRIHPQRIEEVVLKATQEADKLIEQFGERACEEVGVTGIPQEVKKVLGRLRFRQSYGQNVLQHSIEVAFLAGELANIVGADVEKAKIAGLCHDMGKAISHEVGGRHAVISAEIGRKFGMDPIVINAMEAHHDDVEKESVEAFLVQAADAISASRPGARRDSAEQFIKRMQTQEAIIERFEGVQKSYIMSAGREMWVFVEPGKVDDYQAKKLADEVARTLESELQFPGEIRVTVFRETRVQAIAR